MIFIRNCGVALLMTVALLLTSLAGCGSSEGGPYYSTTGKVTMDGNPLTSATVNFEPIRTGEDGPSRGAIGYTNEQGNYLMVVRDTKGCPVGNFVVSISTYAEPSGEGEGEEGEEGEEEEEVTPEKVPSAYQGENSKLRASVTSDGDNVFNFDLKSDGS